MLLRHKYNYKEESKIRFIRQRNVWLILNIEMIFKLKLRRQRKMGLDLHKSKVRNVFSMICKAHYSSKYEKSLEILKDFIPIHIGIYPLINGGRKTYKKFELIQKKMLAQLTIKLSKVGILVNYWDKL